MEKRKGEMREEEETWRKEGEGKAGRKDGDEEEMEEEEEMRKEMQHGEEMEEMWRRVRDEGGEDKGSLGGDGRRRRTEEGNATW